MSSSLTERVAGGLGTERAAPFDGAAPAAPAARHGASFRDPSGFVFRRDGRLYRQVNQVFAAEYDACVRAGLYDALAGAGLLVPHREADLALALGDDAHAVLEPELLPFVSYPYEWSFGELKDAALCTLDVLAQALARGFVLRDASAYNVQFRDGRPLFIDTLSLAPYVEGEPWVAYQQFCEHFLLPLALVARCDERCGQLLRAHLEGVPLELGSRLLPARTWADPRLLIHVHLHARAKRRYGEASVQREIGGRRFPKAQLVQLVASLRETVQGLDWKPEGTEWADYVGATNYSDAATAAKQALVRRFVERAAPRTVWDLGANTGAYTRIAREVADFVVAFDVDVAAVERHYRAIRAERRTGILPLVLDLTNPSPATGWGHGERQSLEQRGPADTVMALALVHHLAIGHNVPLTHVADYLARLGRTAIVEFVEKEDSQVQRLLRNRPDIFPEYTREGFERAMATRFTVTAVERVGDARRLLYLLARHPVAGDDGTC